MEQMYLWLFVLIITSGMVGLTTFLYRRFEEKRWIKYIPALIGIVVMIYYYIKILLPTEGFQDIIYILMLIFTGVTTGITLLVAIFFDVAISLKKRGK